MRRRLASATVATVALMLAQVAQAQACSDEPGRNEIASSARLVEFETLMMTVSLRCTRAGIELRSHYENMVANNAARFGGAQAAVERYLGAGHGAGYDRYVTRVANRYGGGATSQEQCSMFRAVAQTLARKDSDPRALVAVAYAMIAEPTLRQDICNLGN